ncbi:hypothetical protein RJJ37_00685 [Rhizobium redzepovicii]|jgi:hypothetical protein|uniref:Uncharacterized protein n=1 Tax=Rhizobium redzepovicii TaxID=2867518 RepID=A0AAW8NTE8_9HYPH|nr:MULTISPECIES: hypothetical protein [Rhizobium]MBB3520828.1 hypothetical protein [Rhizobium sp. BK456]MBY4591621.1 hypothetical protein [Rhizobium redzepovicii]MBY4613300.1 hypothetical protein [Rhizobium redzepovicii]MDF0657860.1 hypothetical protein [Rhizobium sp. BC49]MDR9758163.1 hypothetical protein [Rhizobium redzepovicii]
MSLLKFFLRPALALGSADALPAWKNDPLRHPEVERMSMREIADLPIGTETNLAAEAKPTLAKCA